MSTYDYKTRSDRPGPYEGMVQADPYVRDSTPIPPVSPETGNRTPWETLRCPCLFS